MWQITMVKPKFKINNSNDFELLKLDEIKADFPSMFKEGSNDFFRLFHINKIEEFPNYMDINQAPYRKTVTDFMLITKGTSVRSKGLNKCKLTANTIFFVPAYQIRTVDSTSKDLQGYFCHFDIEIFNKKPFSHDILSEFSFLKYIGNPVIHIPRESMPQILWIIKQLEYEYSKISLENFNLICSYLLTLFYLINQFTVDSTPSKSKAAILTQRYKDALMEHIYDLNTVSDYASLLKVSHNYLNRCLKQTIGRTALNLIIEMQLIEAKTLLRQSELNIGEIAFRLTKKNPSDFSRFFKSHTGLTPSEYRENLNLHI